MRTSAACSGIVRMGSTANEALFGEEARSLNRIRVKHKAVTRSTAADRAVEVFHMLRPTFSCGDATAAVSRTRCIIASCRSAGTARFRLDDWSADSIGSMVVLLLTWFDLVLSGLNHRACVEFPGAQASISHSRWVSYQEPSGNVPISCAPETVEL